MGILPIGKCTFELRVLKNYKPSAIIGSVFKILRLARRLEAEGIPTQETSIN